MRKPQPRSLLSSVLSTLALVSVAQATLHCQAPSGSYRVGQSLDFRLGDNGWWPKVDHAYSVTAHIKCSSGGSEYAALDTSNGGSWTVPQGLLDYCSGNQVYVQYTGKLWDVTYWFHILPYTTSCDSITIQAAPEPPKPTPEPPKPTHEPPKPTKPVDPVDPPKTVPPPTKTADPPVVVPSVTLVPTVTMVPTVIGGTTTLVPSSVIIPVTLSVTVTPAPATDIGIASNPAFDPSGTQLPGLPPSSGGQSRASADSNVPVAALGAVGGVAALALIVFGLVMTRKHQRLRREQQEGSGLDHGSYDYDSTMAPAMPYLAAKPEPANDYSYLGAAAASAGTVAVASRGLDYDESAVGAAGARRASDQSYTSAGSLGLAVASAGHAAAQAPYPVPTTTSDALKQQYDLANRLSVASVESLVDNYAGAGMAAAAVHQQLSLKQELDENEEDEDDDISYLQTTSPSQSFASAMNTPAAASANLTSTSYMDATTRSSAYETVPSGSSAYATADSPTLSAASLNSQDIHVPALEPSDWRLTGSGRPESSHIRDLIRNVLDDE